MKRFLHSPALVLLFAMVVLRIISNPYVDAGDWIMDKLLILPAIIIGLSFHEFAHGAVSYALGDPTPKVQGRVTINPASHIDPFGFIALLLAGFGWGVPVEIDPRYYKHRRRDEMLVAFAGVAMNLLLAIVFSFVVKGFLVWNPVWMTGSMGEIVIEILFNVISVNIVLLVFNLLPVPPLDGFGILTQIFNLQKYDWYNWVYDKGFLILLVLILFNVTDIVLVPCVQFVYQLLIDFIIL